MALLILLLGWLYLKINKLNQGRSGYRLWIVEKAVSEMELLFNFAKYPLKLHFSKDSIINRKNSHNFDEG